MTPSDRRNPLALGYLWATRVTGVTLAFALPPLLGAWLDQQFRSSPICVLVGMVLGFVVGIVRLTQLARVRTSKTVTSSDPPR